MIGVFNPFALAVIFYMVRFMSAILIFVFYVFLGFVVVPLFLLTAFWWQICVRTASHQPGM